MQILHIGMLTNIIQAFTIQSAITHIIKSIVNETETHSLCGVSLKNETFWSVPGFPSYQSDCTVPRSDFVAHLLVGVNLGCGLFVVSGNCIHQFLDAFYDVHDYAIHRAELKKMIVVLDSDDLVVPLLSDEVILESLPHTLIVVPRDDSVDLWTVDLSFNAESNPSNKFRFETWTFDHEMILPTIMDLKGTLLKLSGTQYPPYTLHRNTSAGLGNANLAGSKKTLEVYLDGFEFVLCLEFCRKFNCTVDFKTDNDVWWGETFTNHSGTGLLGHVVERVSDLTIGAYFRWDGVIEFTTYSKTMQQAAVKFLVPRPHLRPYYEVLTGNSLEAQMIKEFFQTPILPFPPIIWICLLASYTFNAFTLYCFEFGQLNILWLRNNERKIRRGFGYAVLSTFRSAVFEGTYFGPNLVSEFVLFGLILYFSLIVGNVYSGGLASVMTIPRYEGVYDTLQSLIDGNILWGGITADYFIAVQYTDNPRLRKIIDGSIILEPAECHTHLKANEMALLVENTQRGNTVVFDFVDVEISKNLMVMAEDFYTEQTLAVARKTWPFMYLLNNIILNQQQSGIGKFLEFNATRYTMDSRVQSNLHRGIDQDPQILTLEVEHILGAIFLLICGYLLASVVFIIEVFAGKGGCRCKYSQLLKF